MSPTRALGDDGSWGEGDEWSRDTPRGQSRFGSSGKVRDALAAVRNFEALVGSALIDEDTLSSVLVEIGGACATLREAFEAVGSSFETLARFARATVSELDGVLASGWPKATTERVRLLSEVVERVSSDLTAAADLLDLAERSQSPVCIETTVAALAGESLEMVLSLRSESTAEVHLEETIDALVVCDPQITVRIIALAVALVHGACHSPLHFMTTWSNGRVSIRIEPREAPASRRAAVRISKVIEPTVDVAERAARAAGMGLLRDGDAIVVLLPG